MCGILVLALLVNGDTPAGTKAPRKPSPFAPSLPQLTDEEERQLDEIIDRFIDYDSGRVRGPEGRQAVGDFLKLGPEAIPALIRGLNRAARIEHSCPAVTIAKKLSRMLSSTRDPQLLEFARENVGAGVTRSRHMGVIQDLRVTCMLRKRALLESGIGATANTPAFGELKTMVRDSGAREFQRLSTKELVEAAGRERGPKLKLVLTELGRRRGDAALGALGSAAASYEGDVQRQAREILDRQLAGLASAALKEELKDDRAEIRAAAARVTGARQVHAESELIDLLEDEDAGVRRAAHESLVRLSRGTDFGPHASASQAERAVAVRKWREWLAQRDGR
jgi:hypothetical protein